MAARPPGAKAAYDVLMDKLRDMYSKFGPHGLEYKHDTQQLMGSLGFFYVVWVAVAYLLTRKANGCRSDVRPLPGCWRSESSSTRRPSSPLIFCRTSSPTWPCLKRSSCCTSSIPHTF